MAQRDFRRSLKRLLEKLVAQIIGSNLVVTVPQVGAQVSDGIRCSVGAP